MSTTTHRGASSRRAALPPPQRREPSDGMSISPERWLLQSIAAGELDMHLPALARAIDARQHLLHTMNSIDALTELVVGDRVRINQYARPRYLQGLRATIIDMDAMTATVTLERPIGRFTTGRLRCPPLALDRVGPGSN